jgi:lipopolysaccharide transport system ATP-binding protein
MPNGTIKINNLGIYFNVYHQKGLSKKDAISSYGKSLLKKVFRPNSILSGSDLFWALRHIDLEIQKGEFFGIIGENGSGKSTLLKTIAGILRPDEGVVHVKGKIGALLELGAGFHPDLTGRENIYLNGSILGMKKSEIDAIFDKIVSFSELEQFLDLPVKSYSSGMKVRLGFSVASFIEPQILIIDEALAVGDAMFQMKCFSKINEFIKDGKTILLVSHNTEHVQRFCNRVLLLSKGEPVGIAPPLEMINKYKEITAASKERSDKTSVYLTGKEKHPIMGEVDLCLKRPGYNNAEYRYGNQRAQIIDFELYNNNGRKKTTFLTGELVRFIFIVKVQDYINTPIIGIALRTKDGFELYTLNTIMKETVVGPFKKGDLIRAEFTIRLNLISGDYFLTAGIASHSERIVSPIDMRYDLVHIIVTSQTNLGRGFVSLDGDLIIQRKEM